jgi:hypothetical protein
MIVYESVNLITKEYYIGKSTRTLPKRRSEHHKKSKMPSAPFHVAINLYGKDNFKWDIVWEGDDKQMMKQKEKDVIHTYCFKEIPLYNVKFNINYKKNKKNKIKLSIDLVDYGKKEYILNVKENMSVIILDKFHNYSWSYV